MKIRSKNPTHRIYPKKTPVPPHTCFFLKKSEATQKTVENEFFISKIAIIITEKTFLSGPREKKFFDFYWFLTTGGTKLKKIENFYFSNFSSKHVSKGFQHWKTQFWWFKSVQVNKKCCIWSNLVKSSKNCLLNRKSTKTQKFKINFDKWIYKNDAQSMSYNFYVDHICPKLI